MTFLQLKSISLESKDTMLVLTRKLGESIIIDDNIEVVVLKLTNGLVKLGVKAPRETSVHRAEVAQKIKEEKVEILAK